MNTCETLKAQSHIYQAYWAGGDERKGRNCCQHRLRWWSRGMCHGVEGADSSVEGVGLPKGQQFSLHLAVEHQMQLHDTPDRRKFIFLGAQPQEWRGWWMF